MTEAEQAIADYRAAYEARYGKPYPYPITYDGAGWVRGKTQKVRLVQLRAMTARLQGGSDE